MLIKIPKLSLVLLIGPSGAGKSTFARQHFLPTEVLSSDDCRGLVCNNPNDQTATADAFEVLNFIVAKRLARGLLTVIDATNVQPSSRKPLVQLARQFHCLPVAILLNPPASVCQQRNELREDRSFGAHVVRQQRSQLRRSQKGLKREGFRHIFTLDSVEAINTAVIERVPLWNDRRDERGPFDIIGDLHGCCDELEKLLETLGYQRTLLPTADPVWGEVLYRHPQGRKAVFVGDLVDRGPRNLDVVRLVRNMTQHGSGLCVPGNHDVKLLRKLRGKNVKVRHGLAETLAELQAVPDELQADLTQEFIGFLDGLVSHYVLDDGRLVVAHAGLHEEMHGRGSGKVREFALYGEPTGELDEFGFPVRLNWAADYRGAANVVYGHTPILEPEWLNQTVNIDTGCVFGGKLTALRYPEKEFVSVPAARVYCESARPIGGAAAASGPAMTQHQHDDMLNAADVLGKRIVETRLRRSVTIREENATAALEVMSRFAVNPKWLIYLPPTMSPSETTSQSGLLEHPAEALAYYRAQGVAQVVCEEKHMGSRAVVVICQNETAARSRFGITDGGTGSVYTRTGRQFFNDAALQDRFIERLRAAMDDAGFWQQFNTSWACFDCELMPWSAKAQELLRQQYAATGAAGTAALDAAVTSLRSAVENTSEKKGANEKGGTQERQSFLLQRYQQRQQYIQQFVAAYQQYCWTVDSLDDLKLAPFHLLATQGKVHIDQNHQWHMNTLQTICSQDPQLLLATQHRVVDLEDPQGENALVEWWSQLTDRGGEGMVVKPLDWIVYGKKGLVQPAIKCRGREYLRIIYGPDYTSDDHLPRLRNRSLGKKRSLALREFALGIESLERFVRNEPLRRVHECVFGVLALESEPVDPRL